MYVTRTIYDVKRFIGLPYKSVKKDAERVFYEVLNENGYPKILIKDKQLVRKEFFPEEISSIVLKTIVDLAKTRLETTIKRAVITVPAYFGTSQRDATRDAATLAGIQEVDIINEPTAAALAFQHDNRKDSERNILVYDFGGGTFDVSIVKTKGNHCEVMAVGGNCHLGGIDLTMKLFEHITNDMSKKCGLSMEAETFLVNKIRIRRSCEEIKEKLSTVEQYEWDFYYMSGEYKITITRKLFETLVEDILQKTLQIMQKCISDANFTKGDIDFVVLVGGSTRIPRVRKILSEYFGQNKINTSRNPDQLVAYGAVIYAESLLGHSNVMTVQDVLSQSLGTDVENDKFDKLIPKNFPIPSKKSCKYATINDNQRQMTVNIYQGESAIASQNTRLGQLVISNLTEAPARQTIVEISFCLNKEGILRVEATEIDTNNRKELEVSINKRNLSYVSSTSLENEANAISDKNPKDTPRANQMEKSAKFVLDDSRLSETKKKFYALQSYLTKTDDIPEENKTAFLRKIIRYSDKVEKFNDRNVDQIDAINREIIEFIEKNEN